MGTCNSKDADVEKTSMLIGLDTTSLASIYKNLFQFSYVIGKGGFGQVWKVEKKKDRKVYAMKEMSKARVLAKRSVNSVLNERKILSQLRHPLVYAFTQSLQ